MKNFLRKLPVFRNVYGKFKAYDIKINGLESQLQCLNANLINQKHIEKSKRGEKINLVFVCHRPQVWNSLKTVFEACNADEMFNVTIVAIPFKKQLPKMGFNHEFYETEGAEEFWKDYPCKVVNGYDYEMKEWMEYKGLLHYFSYLKMNATLAELVANVAYNSVKDIYIQLLKNRVHFTERHLKFLYELFFEKSGKLRNSESYLNLFCYVVASYLDYADFEKEKFAINQIWDRAEQLEKLFGKPNRTVLVQILSEKKVEIVGKHPEIQTNYENFMKTLDKEFVEYREAMGIFEDR